MWYHDHVLGVTRLNVYAGPAGFYLLRGGPFDLPFAHLPSGRYEIPIAIQDRSFNAGPGNRARCFIRTPGAVSMEGRARPCSDGRGPRPGCDAGSALLVRSDYREP